MSLVILFNLNLIITILIIEKLIFIFIPLEIMYLANTLN